MNAPSTPKWVRHWASVPSKGLQTCAACGKVLADRRDTVPPLRFFPAIAPVYERATGPRHDLVTVIAAEDTFRWCSAVPSSENMVGVACA